MTIRSRLTIWYGLTFMLLIGVAGVAIWWQLEASLGASTEEALRIHAADVADVLDQRGATIDALEPPFAGIFTALLDPSSGTLDAGPGTPPNLPLLPPGSSSRRLAEGGPTYAFYALTLPDGRMLITGSSLAGIDGVLLDCRSCSSSSARFVRLDRWSAGGGLRVVRLRPCGG